MFSGWLARIAPRPDHPMRDIKSAQRILDELPKSDTYKCLQELSAWVESLVQAEGYRLPVRASILKLLDDQGYAIQRKLQQEYLAQNRQAKYREQALWRALVDYWRSLVNGYLYCLDAYAMGARGADALKPLLPLIAARALHAVAAMHKAMLLHYGPVDDSVWHSLSRVWLFIEGRRLETCKVSLYEHSQAPSALQSEFMKCLFLSSSSPDCLLPQQIDLVERLIDDVAEHFVLSHDPDSRSAFIYDLAVPRPPGRLVAGMAVTGRMRFIGPSMASVKLQELSRALDNPSAISAAGYSYIAPAASLRSVLQHLLFYWSMTPPERRWPRLPAFGRLTVLHGFSDVMRSILYSKLSVRPAVLDNRAMLERQKQDLDMFGFVTAETRQLLDELSASESEQERRAESWLVQNVSLGGYGAILPTVRADWLQIGCLLATRGDDGDWQVGVVRRLQYDAERQTHVGIEILAARMMAVRVKLEGHAHERDNGEEYAILFAATLAGASTCSLLMRAGSFMARRQYRLSELERQYLVEPIQRLEQGEDFEIVEFNVLCSLND